ncbi:MAG: signal peptidase II [Oleiphilaceae bacterium]|jgi:signal peptidase II
MTEQQGKSMISLLWLSAVVLVADLVTKHYASTLLVYATPVAVMPSFNFTLLHNTGAAFSFLATESGWQRWFFAALASVVSIALIRWLVTLRDDLWLGVAIALILGGALGNLYDRITLGYVVDFLHFYWNDSHFPAFNIADSAISIGAGLMIIDVFKSKKDES